MWLIKRARSLFVVRVVFMVTVTVKGVNLVVLVIA